MLAGLDAAAARYATIAKQIWTFAEVGYMEEKSSALLQSELRDAGFTVKAGVAGEPTAFIAEYGSGKPVIAILGEFDALPGLSQDAVPERKPLRVGGAGHGCGHHLFGTASAAAAIALKQWMQANNVKGTLRMIGTPAEEGGAGKVYMVRDGVFADVDAVIAWHPGDDNSVTGERTMANISGKFRFRGVSAHAAAAPERGRSALDAVEAMDFMTNMLREHIPDNSAHSLRHHRRRERRPTSCPMYAEVYYVVRHVGMPIVKDIWGKVVNAAKGAALGTGTTYDLQLVGVGLFAAPQRDAGEGAAACAREGGRLHVFGRRARVRGAVAEERRLHRGAARDDREGEATGDRCRGHTRRPTSAT